MDVLGRACALVAASVALLLAGLLNQQPAPASLDYEYFKTKVQPIFVAKRPGHARCVACHIGGTPMRLQPLAKGSANWSEEDTRKNFEAIQSVAFAGQSEEPITDSPARGVGGRRLLPQWWQALELAERSRVADAASLGDGRDEIMEHVLGPAEVPSGTSFGRAREKPIKIGPTRS